MNQDMRAPDLTTRPHRLTEVTGRADDLDETDRAAPGQAHAPRTVQAKSRRRSGFLVAIGALLVVAGVGWIIWSYQHQAVVPNKHEKQLAAKLHLNDVPVSVVATTVQKGDMPVTMNALGTVTPLANVTIRTQLSGHLTEVAFKEGQMVQKGDFLAQIDPRPYQIALAQAQGQLLHDQALLKNAQIDLERYSKLSSQDSIARQQVDTQQSLVQQYQGTIAADQAQVDNAKLNLDYCHITSPIAGRVGLRQVDAGNYVQPNDTNGIVVITQMQPISVIFSLPEDNLPLLMRRLKSNATLQVTAYDRNQAEKLATGGLMTIDNEIDTTTGTVKLRAYFNNTDGTLFPNQFVNVVLLADTLHDTVVVPLAAIQHGAPGTYVYVVKPDNTVQVRPVKLGPSSGDNVAVTEGLAQSDEVVVDGVDKLRDGAKVAASLAADQSQPVDHQVTSN